MTFLPTGSDRWLYSWALGYAGAGVASLLVPLYALELGGGPFLVGLLASTAAFAGVPGAIIWGSVASRTERRRPFLLVALALVALSLLWISLVGSPWQLVVPNATLWFTVNAAIPVLNLVMVEGYPEREWEARIGRLNAFQGYGWVAGLVVGAVWLAVVDPVLGPVAAQRTFFVVAGGATVVAFALAHLWYPEQCTVSELRFRRFYRRTSSKVRYPSFQFTRLFADARSLYWSLGTADWRRALRSFTAGLPVYLVATGLFFLGFAVFFGPLPAYLAAEQYTSRQIFLLFVVSSVASAVLYSRAADVARRTDLRRLNAGALAARGALFPAVTVVGGVTWGFGGLLVVFGLIGAFWAVIAVTATSLVTRLAPRYVRGKALGQYAALSGVGSGVGSVLGGAIAASLNYTAAFAVAGLLVFAGAGLALFARGSSVTE